VAGGDFAWQRDPTGRISFSYRLSV